MCLAVKNALAGFLTIAGLLGGIHPVQASEGLPSSEHRFAYLDPALPASVYALFYQTLSQDPLWRLHLDPGETQILRLQDFSLQEQAPFYWAQTRLDERQVRLLVQVSMEVWHGSELRWQRTVALDRALRLMGPELRGTGLALINPLAELPAGALTPNGKVADKLAVLKRDLLSQAAHQLLNDYLQHH